MSTQAQPLVDQNEALLQQIDPSIGPSIDTSSTDPMDHHDLRIQPAAKVEFLSKEPEPPSALVRGLSSAGAAFEGAVKGGAEMAKTVLAPEGKTEGEKLKYIGKKLIFDPADEMQRRAQTAKTGTESLGYSVAQALPIVGPFVADVAEKAGTQAGSGDIAGAAGTVLGNVAAGEAFEKAGEATGIKGAEETETKAAAPKEEVKAEEKGEEEERPFSGQAIAHDIDPLQHHDLRVAPDEGYDLGEINGVQHYITPDGETAHIGSLHIPAEERGMGKGTEAVKSFESSLPDSVKKITLDAVNGSEPFWQKMGYKPEYTFDNGTRMSKELTPETEQAAAEASRGRSPYTDFHDFAKKVDNPILRNSVTNNLLNQGKFGETFDAVSKFTHDMTKKSAAKEGGDFGFDSLKKGVDMALKNLEGDTIDTDMAKRHADYQTDEYGHDYQDASARADYARRGYNFAQNNIRPFNNVQQLAHDSASALAAGNYAEARVKLGMMKEVLDKGKDAWVAEASKTSKLDLPAQAKGELPIPKSYGKYFVGDTPATWQNVRIHEAGHAIVGKKMGWEVGDMQTHLHTEVTKGALASQVVDMTKGTNPIPASGSVNSKGQAKVTVSGIKDRIGDVLALYMAGPVAQELHGGVPMETNIGKQGDVYAAHHYLSAIGIPRYAHDMYIDKAVETAKDILTHDSARDILEKHTQTRNPDLPNNLHMDAPAVNKMVDEFLEAKYGKQPITEGAVEGKPPGDNGIASEVGGNAQPGRESGAAELPRAAVKEQTLEDIKREDALDEAREMAQEQASTAAEEPIIEHTPHPEDRISARVPTSGDETPHEGEPLNLGTEHILKNPAVADRVADKIREYPGLRLPKDASTKVVFNKFIRHVADNLKWLHDQIDPEKAKLTAKWYEGANKVAHQFADAFNTIPRQAAGVIATLSPQMDWFKNVSLANRVMEIHTNQKNTTTTPEMIQAAKSLGHVEGMKESAARMVGKKYSDLDLTDKAFWTRLYDEAHHNRDYNTLLPTGEAGDLVRNTPKKAGMQGEPAEVGWGNMTLIGKAISIMEDGSRENISRTLGDNHKVRNFYNNIINPTHPEDVTIDTHAVAAGLLRPFSGSDREVSHNFGGAGGSALTGAQGTYPLIADGYRLAAKELDIPLARMLQSVTWEEIREMFPKEFKTAENKKAIDNIWRQYDKGKITIGKARQQVADYARRSNGAAEKSGSAADAGELSESRVLREATGGTDGGRGTRPAGTVSSDSIVKSGEQLRGEASENLESLKEKAKKVAQQKASKAAKEKAQEKGTKALGKPGMKKASARVGDMESVMRGAEALGGDEQNQSKMDIEPLPQEKPDYQLPIDRTGEDRRPLTKT